MATRNSGFFVQSNQGGKGNFEVVIPRIGGGVSYYWRDNDSPTHTWYGPFLAFGSTEDITAVALIQSNFGSIGNLEVVAQEGSKLIHNWRDDDGTGAWQDPTVLPGAQNIVGAPAFIQSHHGSKGHFEVVAPVASGGLAHWWRDNDAPHKPWHGPTLFGTGTVSAVALLQNEFSSNGNLEVVAWAGAQLAHYWRDDGGTLAWHGPSIFASGVTGNPAFIQNSKGHFEVVAPVASGGLAHWWRDNDAPHKPWHGPTLFGTGTVSAVALLQNEFSSNGNLEVVAWAGTQLAHYWRDDGGTLAWHGPSIFGTTHRNPSTEGECAVLFESGIVGIHAAQLHTGELVLFAFSDFDATVPESRILDPVSGVLQTPPHSHHLFCSGHAFLPDGRLFVAGGHHHEVASLHIFDPAEQHWVSAGTMENGRWYPTCTTLPSGKILTISGTKNGGGPVGPNAPVNNTLQVYDVQAGIGPEEPLPAPFSSHFPPQFATIDLYPFVYVLPSGKLLAHSRNTTRFYDPATRTWDPTQLRTAFPFSRTYPGQGTSVLLPLLPTSNPSYRARVLLVGGGGSDPETLTHATPATETVEILDLGAPMPAWRFTQPMKFARVMADAVLLPDGTVLVVGGSATGRADLGIDPVLDIELFDPTSESWSTMCPMQVPRLYHSTAILLPDARVLMVGKDGIFNPPPYNYPEHRVEMFSPPYLFRGPRPVITAAPTAVAYDTPFTVQSPDASSVASVALLSPGSATHSFNMSQRYVGLTIVSLTSNQLIIQAPPNANIAPPGYYMLFLVNADGVPSVATFIRLQDQLPVG